MKKIQLVLLIVSLGIAAHAQKKVETITINGDNISAGRKFQIIQGSNNGTFAYLNVTDVVMSLAATGATFSKEEWSESIKDTNGVISKLWQEKTKSGEMIYSAKFKWNGGTMVYVIEDIEKAINSGEIILLN